jgi:hypothetical protein
MSQFDQKYSLWLNHHIDSEKNHRRRELLKKGLGPQGFASPKPLHQIKKQPVLVAVSVTSWESWGMYESFI